MSDELNNYLLLIDTSKAHGELEELEAERKALEEKIRKTTEESKKELQRTWMKAVSVMQGTWSSIETIMRAAGVSIPTLYRTVITSAFAAAKILIPIFTAMELTPATIIQGTIGLTQIGVAIAAAIMAQREEKYAAEGLSNLNTGLSGISSLIGTWNF
jgi:hypothetical protein